MREPDTERATILALLHESYVGPAWHGPSVREALDGVTAHVASSKPSDKRNSIWELVLHLAHGRHLLIERIVATSAHEFPRRVREPWWPAAPSEESEEAWRKDVTLLDEYHDKLIAAIEAAKPDQLARVPSKGPAIGQQLLGMALHDTYHAGQIRLLALLYAEAR